MTAESARESFRPSHSGSTLTWACVLLQGFLCLELFRGSTPNESSHLGCVFEALFLEAFKGRRERTPPLWHGGHKKVYVASTFFRDFFSVLGLLNRFFVEPLHGSKTPKTATRTTTWSMSFGLHKKEATKKQEPPPSRTSSKAASGLQGRCSQSFGYVFFSDFSRGTFHFHSEPRDPSFQETIQIPGWKQIRFLKRTRVEKNGKGINP